MNINEIITEEYQELSTEINPNIASHIKELSKYANQNIREQQYELPKYELAVNEIEINKLILTLLPIMGSAKYVYDSDIWKRHGHDEWVFNRDYEINDVLYENQYSRVSDAINSQIKYYNSDNVLPQPQWIGELKKGVAKLKQLQTKNKELRAQVYGKF